MEPAFENIQAKGATLPEQAAEQISKLIVAQHLTCEDKLPSEFELAELLGVGRGTVREGVKLLVARNVLEIRRGKGTYIAPNPGEIPDPLGFVYYPDQFRLALDLFHVAIAECTHNLVVPKLIPIITYAITLFVSLTESRLKAQTLVDHREILDAVCDRDGERAAKTMERHIQYNKTLLEELVLELKREKAAEG